jgi:hypothetical protein
MSASSGTIALKANQGGAVSCIEKHGTCNVQTIILNHVKGLAARKVWAVVCETLGVGERVAKARLAGTRAFTADELVHLLRQERGLELLVALMGDARPAWWVRLLHQMEISDARKDVLATNRRLQKVLHAVDENAALIERAETALVLQDEDFGRAQFAGHRAALGIRNRPVAPAARRK